ncbi:MAG: acyltransferase, partial [Opitutaceae bacterium]
GVNFAVTCGVTLGRRCVIAEGVSFFDTNYHEVDEGRGIFSAPVVVGANVWIGHGAIILPGTRIGDHSVIGAGAVVRGEFPARSLVAGVPAHRVRAIECRDNFTRS